MRYALHQKVFFPGNSGTCSEEDVAWQKFGEDTIKCSSSMVVKVKQSHIIIKETGKKTTQKIKHKVSKQKHSITKTKPLQQRTAALKE